MSYFKKDKASVKLTMLKTPTSNVTQDIVYTDYEVLRPMFEQYAEAHGLDVLDMINLYQVIAHFCEDDRIHQLHTIATVGKAIRITVGEHNRTAIYVDLSVGKDITLGVSHGRGRFTHLKTFEHLNDALDEIDLYLGDIVGWKAKNIGTG